MESNNAFSFLVNLVATLSIVAIVYSILKNIKLTDGTSIADKLAELFTGSHKEERPFYQLFEGYNHSSTTQWAQWIKTQDQETVDSAFWRLADYLSKPASELGSITLEAVKAVIAIGHKDSFEVLQTLLYNSRHKWKQFKTLSQFYEEAAIGLVMVNHPLAKEFLVAELSQVKYLRDVEDLKTHMLTALTYVPDPEEVSSIFLRVIFDKSHETSIRLKAIHLMKEKQEKNFNDFLNKVLQVLLTKSGLKKDDFEIYSLVLEFFIEMYSNSDFKTQSDQIWKHFIEALGNAQLREPTYKALVKEITSHNFKARPEALMQLFGLEPKYRGLFEEALSLKFSLKDSEKSVVKEANNLEALLNLEDLTEEVMFVKKKIPVIELPKPLLEDFDKVKILLATRSHVGTNVLLGKSEAHKRMFVEQVAAQEGKSVIIVDAKTILLSPDKMEEFQNTVRKLKPVLVYVQDFLEVLKVWDGGNRLSEKFIAIVQGYCSDRQVYLLASVGKDAIELNETLPEYKQVFSTVPNEYLNGYVEVGISNSRAKQRVVKYYEALIADERRLAELAVDELIEYTKQLSLVEFTAFYLKYLKTSLLTTGKIMGFKDYQEIMNSSSISSSASVSSNKNVVS